MQIVYLKHYDDFFELTSLLTAQIVGDDDLLVQREPVPGDDVVLRETPDIPRHVIEDVLFMRELGLSASNTVIRESDA